MVRYLALQRIFSPLFFMSDLAPFLSFMRDKGMERLMEENQKLLSIRYVMVKFVAPITEYAEPEEEHDGEGLTTYWRQRVDVLEAANDKAMPVVDLRNDSFYPMNLAEIHQSKVRVGELHSTKALGEYPCSVFVDDCHFNQGQNMKGYLDVRLEFQVGEGETIAVHGSV